MGIEADMIQHGNIKFKWIEDVLVIETQGSFNEEGILAAIAEFKECILNSDFSSWYRLENWNDAMGAPEVFELIYELYQWSNEKGCQATAVVITNCIQESVVKENMPNDVGVFRDQEQAMVWLKKQKDK